MEVNKEYLSIKNMAIAAHNSGDYDKAIFLYKNFLLKQPSCKGIYGNMGAALRRLGKMQEALDCYQQELKNDPNNAFMYFNMGNLYRVIKMFTEADFCYQKALELKSDYIDVYNNWGQMLLLDCRQPEKALTVLTKGFAIDKNFLPLRFNRSMALLLLGKWAEGFAEYNCRKEESEWEEKSLLAFCKLPFWSGESFSCKRLVVIAEQGFGDTLQFCRYLPLVKQRGGVISVAVKKPLMRLLEQVNGVDEVIVSEQTGIDFSKFDLVVFMLDLPYIFGTTIQTVPFNEDYLKPLPAWQRFWQAKIAGTSPQGHKRVGLVWAGNTYGGTQPKRSMILRQLLPLANIANTTYYSLQKGAASQELRSISSELKVIDLTTEIDDFADTLGLVSQLDMVITIDTSVAHLAAAAGITTWVMLPYEGEWRWLIEREDTPWYKNMRLFRQNKSGDWESVVKKIMEELT